MDPLSQCPQVQLGPPDTASAPEFLRGKALAPARYGELSADRTWRVGVLKKMTKEDYGNGYYSMCSVGMYGYRQEWAYIC